MQIRCTDWIQYQTQINSKIWFSVFYYPWLSQTHCILKYLSQWKTFTELFFYELEYQECFANYKHMRFVVLSRPKKSYVIYFVVASAWPSSKYFERTKTHKRVWSLKLFNNWVFFSIQNESIINTFQVSMKKSK